MYVTGKWSTAEDNKLREGLAAGKTTKQLVELLNRKADSIDGRKKTLKLKSANVPGGRHVGPTAGVNEGSNVKPQVAVASLAKTHTINFPAFLKDQLIGYPGQRLAQAMNEVHGVTMRVSGTVITLNGKTDGVDAATTAIEAILTVPKAGDVFEAEVVLTRDYGAFLKLKPFFNGILTKDQYKGTQQTGTKYKVRVVDVNEQGQSALELVVETTHGVSAVKPETVTMDELLDHLNGMGKLISAKIGQKVVLAAYIIAE